jgi:hypothetical protein
MNDLKKIKILTTLFIVGLFLSGITCFPILTEVQAGERYFFAMGTNPPEFVQTVITGVTETSKTHPFLFYGTD